MKKPALILVGIATVCAVWVYSSWRPLGSEPRYAGKTLTSWLIYNNWDQRDPNSAQAEALQIIGTNSIPFLLSWIAYPGPSRFSIFLLAPGLNIRNTRQELSEASFRAFQVLGADAASAIPDLVRLTKGTNLNVSFQALCCIEAIGKPAIPVVFDILTNRESYCPDRVFNLLGTMSYLGTNVDLTIPGLLECLRSQKPTAAATAASLLGEIRHRPDIVVPALTQSLADSYERTRSSAAHALGRFQDSARSAIPALAKALNDPMARVRYEATNALIEITPEFLELGPTR